MFPSILNLNIEPKASVHHHLVHTLYFVFIFSLYYVHAVIWGGSLYLSFLVMSEEEGTNIDVLNYIIE